MLKLVSSSSTAVLYEYDLVELGPSLDVHQGKLDVIL